MRRCGFTPPTSHLPRSESFGMRSTVSEEVKGALRASIDARLGQRLWLAPAAGARFSPRGFGGRRPNDRLGCCDRIDRAPQGTGQSTRTGARRPWREAATCWERRTF